MKFKCAWCWTLEEFVQYGGFLKAFLFSSIVTLLALSMLDFLLLFVSISNLSQHFLFPLYLFSTQDILYIYIYTQDIPIFWCYCFMFLNVSFYLFYLFLIAPDGLSPPTLANATNTSLNVSWSAPLNSNAPGPLQYSLQMRTSPQRPVIR